MQTNKNNKIIILTPEEYQYNINYTLENKVVKKKHNTLSENFMENNILAYLFINDLIKARLISKKFEKECGRILMERVLTKFSNFKQENEFGKFIEQKEEKIGFNNNYNRNVYILFQKRIDFDSLIIYNYENSTINDVILESQNIIFNCRSLKIEESLDKEQIKYKFLNSKIFYILNLLKCCNNKQILMVNNEKYKEWFITVDKNYFYFLLKDEYKVSNDVLYKKNKSDTDLIKKNKAKSENPSEKKNKKKKEKRNYKNMIYFE